jgi:hypothetical protein
MHALFLSLFLHMFMPQAQPQLAVLEGRLLHLGTSQPIEGARISLARLNPNMPQTAETINAAWNVGMVMRQTNADKPGYVEGFLGPTADLVGVPPEILKPLQQIGVVTDETGSFTLKDLLPGRYILSAERSGYFGPRYPPNSGSTLFRLINIETGTRPPSLELYMKRGGVISGRVQGPQGEAVTGIRIAAYSASYPLGRATWSTETYAATDDRGEYRLGPLAPGEYFLGTVPPLGTRVSKWTDVYYPGVTNPAVAAPVVVTDSAEIPAITFNLAPSNSPTFKISGTAINTAAIPNNRGVIDPSISSFYVVSREPSLVEGVPSFQNSIPAGSRPNGEFQIRDIKPGSYDIYPQANFMVGRGPTVRASVTVRDADVNNISMSVTNDSKLEAELSFDGNSAGTIKLDSLSLRLQPADTLPELLATGSLKFDSTGKLVSALAAARYTLSVLGLPENAYVSDIHQSGKSVYNEGIVVSNQPAPVRITINSGGAKVTGIVRSADRKPAGMANVILVPAESRRGNPVAFKTVVTDGEGRFSIPGVAPGGYTIFALQSRPYREPWLNAAFLARYQDRARLISATARSTVDTQLELIADRF